MIIFVGHWKRPKDYWTRPLTQVEALLKKMKKEGIKLEMKKEGIKLERR